MKQKCVYYKKLKQMLAIANSNITYIKIYNMTSYKYIYLEIIFNIHIYKINANTICNIYL